MIVPNWRMTNLDIQPAVSLENILDASERIHPHIVCTPVLTCAALDELVLIEGVELFCKCENLQVTGSFKFRGACNAVFGLSDCEAARGIVTHSSGKSPHTLPSPRAAAAGSAHSACSLLLFHILTAIKLT